MEVRPLGLADGDLVERVDSSTVEAVDGGDGVVVWTNGRRAHTIAGDASVEIDLESSTATISSVAAGETVAVVSDETLYEVTGAVATQQLPIPKAEAVYTGPGDKYLTVVRDDGSFVWVDSESTLQQVGSRRTGVDPAEAVVSSGYGWTAISAGETVECYKEPEDGSIAVAAIGTDFFEGTVRDIAFLDGQLVIATTEELVAFETGGRFEANWRADVSVDGLSNSAPRQIYAWADSVFTVEASGTLEEVEGTSSRVVTTSDHGLSYREHDGEGIFSRRPAETEVTLSVEPVSYSGRSTVTLEVSNDSVEPVEETIEVETENFDFRATGEQTVSVPPLSEARIELGTVSVTDQVDDGTITVVRTTTGECLARSTEPVEYGHPNIQTEIRLSEIDSDGPQHTVTVENTGDGVAFVAPTDGEETAGQRRIGPDESVEFDCGTDRKLLVQDADPDSETRTVDIDTGGGLPDPLCEVTCSLGSQERLLSVEFTNLTEAAIRDEVTVDIEDGQRLTGVIEIRPAKTERVWLDAPRSLPTILHVSVDGECIQHRREQITEHQFLELERRYYHDGSETKLNTVPLGSVFREEITVGNKSDETMVDWAASGTKRTDLPDLDPGETVSITRRLSLPTGDASVPAVQVGDDDSQAVLKKRDTNQRRQLVKLLSSIWLTEEGVTMVIEVDCDDSDSIATYRLDSLKFVGESLLDRSLDVDREFAPGDTHRQRIRLPIDTDEEERLENQSPRELTAEFTRVRTDGRELSGRRRSTLVPCNPSGFCPALQASAQVESSRSLRDDKHRLTIEQSVEKRLRLIVKVKTTGGKRINTKKVTVGSEPEYVPFKTSSRSVVVEIEGSRRSWIQNEYRFRRTRSNWRLTSSSEDTALPMKAVTTQWDCEHQ